LNLSFFLIFLDSHNFSCDCSLTEMVMEIDSSNPNGEDGVNKINGHDHDSDRRHMAIIEPHSELPKPEAPAGLFALPPSPSSSPPSGNYSFKFGKFIRERSNNFSAAIVKKLNSLDDARAEAEPEPAASTVIKPDEVTQFNISGLKVVVKLKSHGEEGEEKIKGRISFFSRSNCRDCTAVRRFFKQRGLKFVEINVDVFPPREKELIRRTGSSQVPQVFLNDKLFGGLVALNSLRNSGTFDERFREMLGRKCSGDAPAPPLYGFDDDDEEEESMDEMLLSVKLLRQRLPIQDRLIKLKIVKNCFSGSEMVDVLTHHFKCDRMKVRFVL
ncbi:hypothetical protein CISIN_1g039225mg, partial [Citrus sinensis]